MRRPPVIRMGVAAAANALVVAYGMLGGSPLFSVYALNAFIAGLCFATAVETDQARNGGRQ